MKKNNKTLKDILDVILYDNPSTQDEIAEKLDISRRYVTKLLKPLIDEDIVKRGYILDLKKYDGLYSENGGSMFSDNHSATFLIKEMLENMSKHVLKQLKTAFGALMEGNKEKAELAMEMDYATNNMFEKLRSSVETIVSIDPSTQFSKTLIFNEIAYDLERIGDYCGHFSKFVINEDANEINKDIIGLLKSMYDSVDKMIQNSMNAFLNEELSLKGDIMDLEEKIHLLQKKALNYVADEMAEASFEEKEESFYYIYLSRLVKSFERIGDICVEILDTAIEFHKNIPRSTIPRNFRK